MLTPRTKIGPYEILSALGSGGMGEVYRARDTKLGREVALKVLPEGFGADAERMRRFEREAKVLASLNHPNIATIYGFEDSGGVRALVMELVEGQTLAEMISGVGAGLKPAPTNAHAMLLSEALPIARQIAEGLEYAHERGIVHRDLKPANVKITPDGVVKILDFGLAKAIEGEMPAGDISSSSPTLTHTATQAGIILGTASYMSPEQAKGKPVDRRADIWAFGCVLYEMLTGRRAFEGKTVSDILAAVIRAEPNWAPLPASTPAAIRKLLARCLQKDAKQRLQAVGEARIAIDETLSGTGVSPVLEVHDPTGRTTEATVRDHRSPLHRALPWALACITSIALLIAIYAYWRAQRPVRGPVVRFAISVPSGQGAAIDTRWLTLALSPDGGKLVYVGGGDNHRLYLRPLDKLAATALAGTEGASSPFFSPDGKWIGFFADGKLEKVALAGGDPITLCDAPTNRGGTWLPDGTILFSPTLTSGLMRVPDGGGTPTALTTPDTSKGERTHRWPDALPGGGSVLFTLGYLDSPTDFDNARIAVLSLATGKYKVVLDRAAMARYVSAGKSNGYLLYARTGELFAAPFDAKRLRVTGESLPVIQGVNETRGSGASLFAVADNGSLAYVPGGVTTFGGFALDWMDRQGKPQPIPVPSRYFYQGAALSPDGRHIAVATVGAGNSAGTDIYIWSETRQVLSRLTFSGQADSPVWTPDGKRVAYRSEKPQQGIYWKAADGSGPGNPLVLAPVEFDAMSFSPDGKFLAYTSYASRTNTDIWILPLTRDRKPYPFLATPANESSPKFSSDGRWLAYVSDETGKPEVYVRAFPGPGGKWQISSGSVARRPIWASDGRELYYLAGRELMAVPVKTRPTFSPGAPKELFENSAFLAGGSTGVAYLGGVSPNARRFLMLLPAQPRTSSAYRATPIDLVLNFGSELTRLGHTDK